MILEMGEPSLHIIIVKSCLKLYYNC